MWRRTCEEWGVDPSPEAFRASIVCGEPFRVGEFVPMTDAEQKQFREGLEQRFRKAGINPRRRTAMGIPVQRMISAPVGVRQVREYTANPVPDDFAARVNAMLAEGWFLVPGTLIATSDAVYALLQHNDPPGEGGAHVAWVEPLPPTDTAGQMGRVKGEQG